MISKEDFINAIIANKQENGISAFVGAGLCSDAQMPDWLHLLQPCAEELGVSIDENTDLFKFAQYYANTFGYNKLRKLINKTLNTYQHDSTLVSSILNVGFKSIWTTNYDKIIENNIIKLNAFSNTIFDEKDLVNISWQNRINIFKLNGDISNLNNIVITQNDIDNYQNNHALFLTFLKRELVTNTFIFIGYSFNDHIVLSALAEINHYLGESSNTHYTIMKNKHTDDFKMFIEDLEKRYHIKTVLVEEYVEIPLLLDKLKRRILDSNVFISGSFEYLSSEEDTHFRKLLINNANSTIYMFGQHLKNGQPENSRGTLEEYELAKSMKKIIIPIGVTGYSSREIFNDAKRNLIYYPYLEQYIDVLENEKDVDVLSSCIVAILNRVKTS